MFNNTKDKKDMNDINNKINKISYEYDRLKTHLHDLTISKKKVSANLARKECQNIRKGLKEIRNDISLFHKSLPVKKRFIKDDNEIPSK